MKEESVNYFENTIGFYVEPEVSVEETPGIVLIHEWWGLNENIKNYARKLASGGYRVLAVDLFGRVSTNKDDAAENIANVSQLQSLMNMKSALKFLREKGATKVASLGFCFGGAQSLFLAVSGEPFDATVIYYGRLITDKEKIAKIKWPVLGIFAEKDDHITPQMVREFENTLNSLGIQNQIIEYPNVGHAFANPTGQNFAPAEAALAWAKTLAFLKQNLR